MKHLTEEQRYIISAMKQCNICIKDIAIAVNKDKSTIYRELSRNCDKRNGNYAPKLAQKNVMNGIKKSLKKCILHLK